MLVVNLSRPLQLSGQPAAIGIAAVGHVLDIAVLEAGALGPGAGLLGGGGEPVDLLLRGGAAALRGVDHAAQPGEALRAPGGGAGGVSQLALGGGERRLGGG